MFIKENDDSIYLRISHEELSNILLAFSLADDFLDDSLLLGLYPQEKILDTQVSLSYTRSEILTYFFNQAKEKIK